MYLKKKLQDQHWYKRFGLIEIQGPCSYSAVEHTWLPRDGTTMCTIHWASTTPIFSYAVCIQEYDQLL